MEMMGRKERIELREVKDVSMIQWVNCVGWHTYSAVTLVAACLFACSDDPSGSQLAVDAAHSDVKRDGQVLLLEGDGAAGDAVVQDSGNESKLEWDTAGALGAPELLYDLGENTPPLGRGLFGIIADGTHLYFTQNTSHLSRASKEPGGQIELIAEFASPFSAYQGWLMDGEYLFFAAADRIRRLHKPSQVIVDFPLGGNYGTVIMVDDEDSLYLATPSCGTMMTMDKVTGEVRDVLTEAIVNDRGGSFSVIRVGETLYCSGGAGGLLYERATAGGPKAVKLALPGPHPDGYLSQVGMMFEVDGALRFMHEYNDLLPHHYWVASVDSAASQLAAQNLTGAIPGNWGFPLYDKNRRRAFWHSGSIMTTYWVDSHEWVVSDPRSHTEGIVPDQGYLAMDADYIYWHTRNPRVRIYRQRKL